MPFSEYEHALAQGRKELRAFQSKGLSPYLPVLSEILAAEETLGEVDLGLVDIPLEQVIGTKFAGRSLSFSHSFHPLMETDTEFAAKWMALCRAHMEEGIQDPIKAFEYMGTFYVLEGHKRVSVLRHFGAVAVPAYVTRILPARDGSLASKIYYEFVDFYSLSGVNYLWFSGLGRFAQLQHAVGKQPQEVWTAEERQDLFSLYLRFSEAYLAKGSKAATEYITTGDALLLLLTVYGYPQLKDCSCQELKSKLSHVRSQLQEIARTEGGLPSSETAIRKLLQTVGHPFAAVTEAMTDSAQNMVELADTLAKPVKDLIEGEGKLKP